MRDPELMIALLREMGAQPSGRHVCHQTYGMSEAEQSRLHHVELLVDAGHAQQTVTDSHIVRITNAGYDFLNAVDQDDTYRSKFIELFQKGKPYVEAALDVVKLVAKAAGG